MRKQASLYRDVLLVSSVVIPYDGHGLTLGCHEYCGLTDGR